MHVTSPYVGRLAPSPTGLLHLGHAATFLAAHDRARAANGRLVLRIDDLDAQRSRQMYVDAAKEDLGWLGITWEEEVRESDRLEHYRAALRRLVMQGHAYPCKCSRKDLQQAMQAPHEDADDEPIYSGRCRPANALHASHVAQFNSGAEGSAVQSSEDVDLNTNYRLRVPDRRAIDFTDGSFGPQHFLAGEDFGDFLVWRKDGLPSYQLACVVDDAEMGITEVVRGRDLLKSTARQILLQRALGFPTPAYFHTGLLRDEQGQRLAKRHDALSLRTLREQGVTASDIRARVDGLLHHTES